MPQRTNSVRDVGNMKVVRIEGKSIGCGSPCFVIAEAGSNHNGDLDLARRQIDIAARCGADAIKFQVFRASRMYPRNAGVSNYLKSPNAIYDIISAMEMPYEWIPILAEHSRTHGLIFLASVFDEESVEQVAPYVPAFKIASYEMTHLPLVEHVCKQGKPVIISTGTATLAEVEETVEACRQAGNDDLILLQCTASYPAPLDTLNIRAMTTLAEHFNVPVGLSDHSRDPIVGPVPAVACGASIIEKHFTVSNELPGPDHAFAVEPTELSLMVQQIRGAEQALGMKEKLTGTVEEELRSFARRTIFSVVDIEKGKSFAADNIAVLRCGNNQYGFSPRDYHGLLGRKAARFIPADTGIQSDDVD